MELAAPREPAFFVRRADPDDVDTVLAMFDRAFAEDALAEVFARFHRLDPAALRLPARRQHFFVSLIETCFMSVTVEDEEGNVAAFAALDDVPVQMAGAMEAGTVWEDWFQRAFPGAEADGANALWFSCLLAEPEAAVMAELLRTAFSTMRDLQHLLVFVPPDTHEEAAAVLLRPLGFHFRQLEGPEQSAPPGHWAASGPDGQPPRVLACSRSSIIAPLCIRSARVEDHDNLSAIFDAQSEVVTEVYGEYFIAELIEAQNEENKALVAEVEGRAVGLLCLTSDVDVNVLAQCFQLEPYDNLLKPEYMERVRVHAEATLQGEAASLCSVGDYMQVALASVDLEGLLEALPRHEDGRVNAVHLHGVLQQQEFSDEVGEAVQDFERGVMTLLWQASFLEPLLEGGSLVDPRRVREAAQTFAELDVTARRSLAQQALERWDEAAEVLRATRELLSGQEAGGEEEAGEEAGLDEAGEEEAEQQPVELRVFLRALTQEQEGPFAQDFLVRLIMALHWWTGEDLGGPVRAVPPDAFRGALEELVDSEEGLFVGHPSSPGWLASMPQHAKDVFCINMCCLDQTHQAQALDFLLPAFSMYPEKDYCIVTQPHTAPNTPLLNAFTIVPPQPQNTFGHVLYLIHRAALLGPPRIRYLRAADLGALEPLVQSFEESARTEISRCAEEFLHQEEAGEERLGHAFVADFDDQVVGLVMLQVPPPDAVDTLRCCYHLDDYLLVEHHERLEGKGHAHLLHWAINPLFQKYARKLMQGAMRLCGRTVLFMETELNNPVSPIFREMLQVAPRRPPQLKKVSRKPPKVASFVNVEKEVPTEEDLRAKERQQLLRDVTQTKALSIVPKKLLSETKLPVNARIVVVGASDCGLSFLESLLSIPHLSFGSLALLAPGGLEYHHAHHLPLVAGTAAYSHQELRRIMLELRVRILDSRLMQIDRQQRCCVLHDGSLLPYDHLIVAAGLQDDALHALRIRSWGVEHVTDGYRRVNGAMSVADPSIRDLLVEGGTLVKSLIWNPLSYAVVYGRSLHAYCVVQGLLMRKVPPTKIILVLPPRLKDASQQLPVEAFYEGDEVERKIHQILESMSVRVYEGYRLLGIQQDNRERLKALLLEEHTDGPPVMDDGSQTGKGPEAPLRAPTARARCGVLEDHGATPAGLPQKLLACRILITADSANVDPDIFNSLHGNGLVYDGRLIVDHGFKTTDDAIFGAGALCEFSRRFQRKNAERYLRHDGFNGREVGAKLAQALLRVLDPVNGDLAVASGQRPARGSPEGLGSLGLGGAEGDGEESSPELLPEFYMPIAKGGLLPGNLHYYRIHSCRRGELRAEQAEPRADHVIVTDTLDTTNGKGHFCRLTIDNFGKVDSITYLGGEELQVESLWSLVGLSETFLNHLFVRWRDGDIPDIVEFLTDEWAMALFHDRFMDFCHQIKLEMLSQEEVKVIVNNALETVNLKEGLSRELLAMIRARLPKESVKTMQDHLLDYLRENTNHLKAYFLPENWEQR